MTEKEWQDFLTLQHALDKTTKDYTPNKISIELWEEYRASLSNSRRMPSVQ